MKTSKPTKTRTKKSFLIVCLSLRSDLLNGGSTALWASVCLPCWRQSCIAWKIISLSLLKQAHICQTRKKIQLVFYKYQSAPAWGTAEQAKEPSLITGQGNQFYFPLCCSPKVGFTWTLLPRSKPGPGYSQVVLCSTAGHLSLSAQNKCLTCSNPKPFPSTHDLFLSSQLCLRDAAMKEGKVTGPVTWSNRGSSQQRLSPAIAAPWEACSHSTIGNSRTIKGPKCSWKQQMKKYWQNTVIPPNIYILMTYGIL